MSSSSNFIAESAEIKIPGQVYLVGGAVRDALLKLEVKDRDFVVVGATVQAMLDVGFKQVGADFPVFLHPITGEEYALARTERKSGKGYKGFSISADPGVTLQDDLARRDFTINAIAQESDGTLIDPYGGINDLENRVLRHVGPAFVEDPLRILRAARFMSRFAPLGFEVASETQVLMRQMILDGALNELVPERVFSELKSALSNAKPSAFFQTLRDVDGLQVVLPEVDALYGVPQTATHHPEIDTGRHVELVLDQAAKLAPGDAVIGFCALTHDLGKALTPADVLPRHIGHESAGVDPLLTLCTRLRVPTEMREVAVAVCRDHLNMHRLSEMRPSTIQNLLTRIGAYRLPNRVRQFAISCEADARGRDGFADREYPQRKLLMDCYAVAAKVGAKDVTNPHLEGPAIGEEIVRLRTAAIKQVLTEAQRVS